MSIRLCIVQPHLPHYSASFFKRLSRSDAISDVRIMADLHSTGDLNTVNRDEVVSLVHVPYVRRFGLVFRPGRFRKVLRHSADIYVFSGDQRDFGAMFIAAILRLMGRKVIFWGMFHRIGGPGIVSQIAYTIMGRIANACIAYAKIGALNLISLGVRREKVFVGGTAIDEGKSLEAARRLRHQDLLKFKVENGLAGKRMILQVVRLSSIKKPLFLLELACALRDRGRQDVVIVALGGGEMLEQFRARLESLDLGEVVRILPPEYDEDKLAHWFLAADVFTIPTCIGLSAHHAFSYGVPIVTDNSLVDQASEFEVVSNGLNGLTYEADDVTSYATAIETILNDPEMRAAMSRNAMNTVRNVYNLANKVQAFEQAFVHIASKR